MLKVNYPLITVLGCIPLSIIEYRVHYRVERHLKSPAPLAPAMVSNIAYHGLVPIFSDVVSRQTGMVTGDVLAQIGARLAVLLNRHVPASRRRTCQLPEMTSQCGRNREFPLLSAILTKHSKLSVNHQHSKQKCYSYVFPVAPLCSTITSLNRVRNDTACWR